MRLRRALANAASAARVNLLPGLLLQGVLVAFLAAYFLHDGTREFLGRVARLKSESGYTFAFVSYVLAAALLPELLRIVFFQRGRMTRRNVWSFATAAPFWGLDGVLVDFFYRCQAVWFGTVNTFGVVAAKVAVDQFLFSPFLNSPLIVGYFLWRDGGFRRAALPRLTSPDFWWERVLPVQVAGWMIWIPAVSVVYAMPPLLQLPVAVLIQVFWILILTTLQDRGRKP